MNHHDQLEISVQENEIGSWRERCNSRIESLKARDQSSNSTDDQDNQRSSVLIFELLLEALRQNGDVDQFIDVLENNISSSSSSSSSTSPSSSSLGLSEIFDKVSPSGDSLLHDAVFYGREEIAEIISHHFPQLLTKKNVYGNSPLHVASARSNNSSIMMIQILLSEYGSNNETELTRITNEYGNTALHEAVYGKNLLGADVLFDADKRVAHYLNNSKVSPFYLAVHRSYGELVGRWLEAEGVFAENIDLPRSHGISPLHAAISTKNADLLQLMVEKESHLKLMKLRGEHGRIPIHFAAKTGYAAGVRILLEKSPLTAKEFDMKGNLPIHLASKRGHVEVVKEFCERIKTVSLLRGLTIKEGQNILHVAAKHGHEDVVKYVLRNTKLDVNQKDKNGNSPLHFAAQNLHYSTALSLALDRRIDVNAMNNEGLTARDLVLLKRDVQRGVGQDITNMVLKFAGGKESGKSKKLLKRSGEQSTISEEMKKKMETLMVVTILIVAMTYIAGFTVPGGVYSSQDPNPNNRGTAIFGHKPMFKIFALFNMVAMYSSIFGAFFLLWAHIGNLPSSNASSYSLFMVGLALSSMTLSFMAALSLVVSTHVSWISSLTIFIGICSFCAILIWSNASWSIFLSCIVSRYRDVCFQIFLSVISAVSAVTLLAIVVAAPVVLLLYILDVVH